MLPKAFGGRKRRYACTLISDKAGTNTNTVVVAVHRFVRIVLLDSSAAPRNYNRKTLREYRLLAGRIAKKK